MSTKDYYAGITEGRMQERERILKALEEWYTNDEDDWAIDWAIEIVKKLGGTK